MIKSLIYCQACNQAIPNYQGYDLSPDKSLPGVEWSDADLAGAKEFLCTHLGHKLEELLIEEDSWVSEKPSHEPLRASYCYAGNAGKRFLVRRTKSALNQSASYEIVPGSLEISNVSLKIQENDLRGQIAADKGLSPLLKERMERFLQVFRDEIAKISPDKIEEEIGEIDDEEGSTLLYAGLNGSRWKKILSRCRLYFDNNDLKALRGFIEENRNPPEVLSVQIERRISIILLEGKETVEEETEEEMKTPSVVTFKKKGS
jgi:hypothetical protein